VSGDITGLGHGIERNAKSKKSIKKPTEYEYFLTAI